MFSKVLIAEDFDCIGISIEQALKELSISEFYHAKYCDDAILKIKKALYDKNPYDLLISDLSFKSDFRENKLNSGEELIAEVKKIQPNIKTIVYSIEDKSFRIKSLFETLEINDFVFKGRNSVPELKKSINHVYENVPSTTALEWKKNDSCLIEIENYDIEILQLLAKGYLVDQIASDFKKRSIKSSSVSSVEKRISRLKVDFKANNTVQLIAVAKDMGVV